MLEEAMTSHSQTASKLADATGVPERFIAAIIEGNFGILPAAPYVRGYIKKIAAVLDLDGEILWERYDRETKPRQSGGKDHLPENRFAIKTPDKRWIAGALI